MRSKKNGKIRRVKKAPGAPKQPLTPYLEFAMAERSTISKDLGQLSLTEMGQELGRRWRCLDASKKTFYEEKSKANREEYRKKLREYNLSNKIPDGGVENGIPEERSRFYYHEWFVLPFLHHQSLRTLVQRY